jgi:hypothetical protein
MGTLDVNPRLKPVQRLDDIGHWEEISLVGAVAVCECIVKNTGVPGYIETPVAT